MIKNTDLAYISGYIDGDGCFHIGKRKRKNTISPTLLSSIIIVSVNPEILGWIKSLIGGSIHLNNKVPKGHKPIYHYTLRKTRAVPFAKSILNFLIEKREEAEIFINSATAKNQQENEIFISKMQIVKNFCNLIHKELKAELEPFKKTVEPSTEDFAYLAGFIDAECCLTVQRYHSNGKPNYLYKIVLSCNNTKSTVFKWLLQRFGGSVNFINRKKPNNNQRDQLQWRLVSASLAKILPKIYPFLRHKKPVCNELMKLSATILPNGGARHTEAFRSQYSQVLKVREEITTKIHLLNSKGI